MENFWGKIPYYKTLIEKSPHSKIALEGVPQRFIIMDKARTNHVCII